MKKLLVLFIATMIGVGLLGCSENKAEDNAADSQEINTQTEEAVSGKTAMQQAYEAILEDNSFDEYQYAISYDEERDSLVFSARTTQAIFESVLEICKPFVADETLKIDMREIEASKVKTPFEFLVSYPCKDIDLAYSHTGNVDVERISSIKGLTTATIRLLNQRTPLTEMPYLTELTIECTSDTSLTLEGLSRSAKLESLAFTFDITFGFSSSRTTFVEEVSQLPNLIELKLDDNGHELTDERLIVSVMICSYAQKAPSIETIDGTMAATWDAAAELNAEQYRAYEEAMAMQYMWGIYDRFEKDEIAPGAPQTVSGKVMVLVVHPNYSSGFPVSSPASTAAGESYAGVDASAFTADPAECSQIIFVYSSSEDVGNYVSSTGQFAGSASKTFTLVCVYDVRSDTVSEPYVAAEADPPQETSGRGGASGEFLPEQALGYVASLIQR